MSKIVISDVEVADMGGGRSIRNNMEETQQLQKDVSSFPPSMSPNLGGI